MNIDKLTRANDIVADINLFKASLRDANVRNLKKNDKIFVTINDHSQAHHICVPVSIACKVIDIIKRGLLIEIDNLEREFANI